MKLSYPNLNHGLKSWYWSSTQQVSRHIGLDISYQYPMIHKILQFKNKSYIKLGYKSSNKHFYISIPITSSMGLESNPDLEFSFRVEFGSTQDWIMQGAPCAIKEPKYHTITRSLSKKKKKELSDIFITLIIALRLRGMMISSIFLFWIIYLLGKKKNL